MVGAINSENCFEWAKQVEQKVEERVKQYSHGQWMQDLEECLSGVIVWYSAEWNRFHYIHPEIHSEVSESELIAAGFTKVKIAA